MHSSINILISPIYVPYEYQPARTYVCTYTFDTLTNFAKITCTLLLMTIAKSNPVGTLAWECCNDI